MFGLTTDWHGLASDTIVNDNIWTSNPWFFLKRLNTFTTSCKICNDLTSPMNVLFSPECFGSRNTCSIAQLSSVTFMTHILSTVTYMTQQPIKYIIPLHSVIDRFVFFLRGHRKTHNNTYGCTYQCLTCFVIINRVWYMILKPANFHFISIKVKIAIIVWKED